MRRCLCVFPQENIAVIAKYRASVASLQQELEAAGGAVGTDEAASPPGKFMSMFCMGHVTDDMLYR